MPEDETTQTPDEPTVPEAAAASAPKPPPRRTASPWTRWLASGAIVIAMFLVGRVTAPRSGSAPSASGGAETKVKQYHCPMHPTYTSDKPGECPICGMTLVPVDDGGEENGEEEQSLVAGLSIVKVTPEKQQLIGLRTGTVTFESADKTVRTVGVVQHDETLLSHVHTKFDGWIEKAFVDYEGKYVRKGAPLLTIYSPELVSTQEEYLLALRGRNALANSEFANVRQGGSSLVEATRRRLQLWDIPEAEIRKIEQTGKPLRALTLYAPASGYVMKRMAIEGMYVKPGTELYTLADLSRVWVLGDIYEYEMPLVKVGQRARLTADAHPGKTFRGVLDYVYPTIDPRTRTARIRFTFTNPGLVLRPGMYVNIALDVPMGHNLVVSEEAVLDSGERKVVFLARGDGKFEPREVTLGQKVGDKYVVLSGLNEGDEIVVNGNFIIDSESRLKASLGGMSMSDHGGGEKEKSGGPAPKQRTKSKPSASGHNHQPKQKPAPDTAQVEIKEEHSDHGAMKSAPAKPAAAATHAQHSAAGKPAAKKTAAVYSCPMHPEVTSDKPGECPECGMTLEKTAVAGDSGASSVYSCPMHPEVTSDKPGRCPKCGMFLEKAEA